MAPSQLLPVLATPKTQMKCSGGIPPMVSSLSPAARRALSREISRSLEASCSCRRSSGLPRTSAEQGTSPRMIPTANLKYALTLPATSISPASVRGSRHYSSQSSSASHILARPVRASRPNAQDLRRRHYIALCFRSGQAGTTICALCTRRCSERPRNLWFALHHEFCVRAYRTVHIFIGQRGLVSSAHG